MTTALELNFFRVKQQNFYVAYFNNLMIFKSYNTIVGVYDGDIKRLYEVKYSRTTSKQVSQYFRYLVIADRQIVDAETLSMILNNYSLDLNTHYNCA